MKALSLYQPWATLIALKAKQIETRSWSTHYRGPLAIHASKNMPAEAKELLNGVEPFFTTLYGYFESGHELPLGAIVAVCDLADVCWIGAMQDGSRIVNRDSGAFVVHEPELSFGDYSLGRYAWLLGNIRQLEFPVTCRGAMGLWQVPPEIVERIKE